MAKKKAAHIYIDEDVLACIQIEAEEQHRNLSGQVELILETWLAERAQESLDRDTPVASVQK